MPWRRKRTEPSVTELTRIQQLLERDAAASRRLGPKSVAIRKRTGETVYFAAETIMVAKALMNERLNPERTHVVDVWRIAAQVLGIYRTPSPGAAR